MGCLFKLFIFFFVVPFVWHELILPLFNKSRRPQWGEGDPQMGDNAPRLRYLQYLMPLLAKLAKADGRISEDEISNVETIFRELNLNADERSFAKQAFNAAKQDRFSFMMAAARFAQAGYDVEMRVLTFQLMVRLAASDGAITDPELQLLLQSGSLFRLPQQIVMETLHRFGGTHFHQRGRHAAPQPDPSQRVKDLALLGLPANATADAIKKAYRQKVKELHPDRLQAQGLPEAMLKQATERMAAINAAYDRLTK